MPSSLLLTFICASFRAIFVFAPFSTASSVTLTVKTSPVFIVTVRVSVVLKGSKLISAQSPLSTSVLLIASISSSVRSAEYWHSSRRPSLISPTVVLSCTLLTDSSSGVLNSIFSTSATKSFVSGLTCMSSSVRRSCSGASVSPASCISPESPSFSSNPLFFTTPRTSMSFSKLTNPPPGIEKT